MKKSKTFLFSLLIFIFVGSFGTVSAFSSGTGSEQVPIKTLCQKIEELTGLKGTLEEKENVFKVSFPRLDLPVDVSGVKMVPSMGLTAWAAFKLMGDHTMVMGDMVLLEDQVNPVMSAALNNGLEVTALHNHFFWDSPRVMFMHIGGMGNPETLATAVGKVFAEIKRTSGEKGEKFFFEIDPSQTTLDPKKIEAILGVSGKMTDGVYKVTIGRMTNMNGHEIGNAMGVNTWAAFVGSDDKAMMDGDFAMFESELQPVLKALRAAHVYIVAIHNHMTMESPRMIFLHFQGVGPTKNLAMALKAALDTQKNSLPGV